MKNAEEALEEFKGRMNAEVRRQERIDMAEKRDFRRGELSEKFIARMLYGWKDGKFEKEYLKKLERKLEEVESSFSRGETLKRGGVMSSYTNKWT